MAGDWIKVECTTPDKPEVGHLAEILNIDPDSVVGKCVRLWIWADAQSIDGNDIRVTESTLDRLTYCPGFAKALRQVGWLSGRECLLTIPNFGRHNGHTAKNRALTKDRVAKTRTEGNAPSVTKSLPEKRREEKRREDEKGEDKKICTEPQSDSVQVSETILVFPCVKGSSGLTLWELTAEKLAQYQDSFPGVDSLAECRKARQWAIDNSAKRKTAKGMAKFLGSWLTRAQDSGTGKNQSERKHVSSAAAKEQHTGESFNALRRARELAGISVPESNSRSISATGGVAGSLVFDEKNSGADKASD